MVPHEKEDGGGFEQLDLLVFQEDKFGSETRFNVRRSFQGRKKKETKKKKKKKKKEEIQRSNIHPKKKKKKPAHLITTLTPILNAPLLHLPSNNRNWNLGLDPH